MTIPNDDQKITYTGTGATATYAYTDIKIFDEDDLQVLVTKLSDLTETTLTIDTDYTISGVGIAAGGNVVLVNASQAWLDGSGFLTSSYSITIKRITEIVQETSITSQSQNNPEYVEKQFDRSIMIDQQQQEQLDRCLKLPATEAGTATNTTLPNVDLRKNSIAAYDADGDPTTAVLSSVGANATASYVTMTADASLPNRRLLTGTANQITVTDNGAGSTVVLSTPQAIGTGSSPTFASVTDSALTPGRVVIAGAAGVLEDDAGLTYAKATDILTVPIVKFTPGAAPSLANGQQWSDSTQIAPAHRTGGMTEYGSRLIYAQTTPVTIANTTSVSTILTTPAFGTATIAANYLTPGKVIKAIAYGTFDITGTPNLTMSLYGAGSALRNGTVATIATQAYWRLETGIVCHNTSICRGFYHWSITNLTGANPLTVVGSFNPSVDATSSYAIDLRVTWGTASTSNTLTCEHASIEVLG